MSATQTEVATTLGPPSRGYGEIGLAAAQPPQSPRAFALDQRLERLAHEGGFLPQPGEGLSLGQQFVIERQGRTHLVPLNWVRTTSPTAAASPRVALARRPRLCHAGAGQP